jgi:hypothetical protein
MSNKRVDRLEVGADAPHSPNDEVVWIDVETNNINRYDESTDEWISVGGGEGANFVVGSSNARTGTGEVLQFTDETNQSVITGPSPTIANSTAQRLVVAGQDGLVDTSGEGGDLYLWAGVGGSGNGSGGDIKVDAGNGGGTTGGGGTVKVRGGDSEESSGGYVRIEGGYSASGYGGDVRLYGGDSNLEPGGDIEMYAGYSSASVGGNVFIEAGGTSTGIGGDITLQTYTDGKINLRADGGIAIKDSNNDDLIFFERTGTGTARIGTPQDDLSLRSARDITLFAGDDGPGNVYIGWGDAVYTPDSPNKVATVGDLGVYPVTEVTASTAFTLSFDHVGKTLYNVSGENVTCTVLLNADEYIPVGSEIKFVNNDSSGFWIDRESEGTTIVGEGEGFSSVNVNFWLPSNGYATLLKVATNNWIFSGLKVND